MIPSTRGYINIARKMFSHDDAFWSEARPRTRFEAWLFLIQLAQWRQHSRQTKYGLITLERGQFVASIRWLAGELQWSAKKVFTFLAECEKQGRIRKHSQHHAGGIYLVVNYDEYQGYHPEEETDSETVLESDRKQTGNKNKQVKQEKQNTKKPTASVADSPDVLAVVAHYTTRHPRRSVSAKARALIAKVLASGWTVADCVAAIDGNADDGWHAEKRKHEVEYVLREDKRDGFREQGERASVPIQETADGWFTPEFERSLYVRSAA